MISNIRNHSTLQKLLISDARVLLRSNKYLQTPLKLLLDKVKWLSDNFIQLQYLYSRKNTFPVQGPML